MRKRIWKAVSVIFLMLLIVRGTVFVSHAAELAHNTAMELAEKKTADGLVDIACATIESAGVIIAAIIGVGGLRKITKEGFDTYFTSFSSENHDLKRVIKRAKDEITIIVAYGDNLLKEYTSLLNECMERGVRVNFLMLSRERALQMAQDYYQAKTETFCEEIEVSLNALEQLTKHDNFRIKIWHYPLPASYIAIDCGVSDGRARMDALIQVMIYQYGVLTPNAPITYLSHKKNNNAFYHTVESLKNMWSRAGDFEHGGYT